MTLQDLIVVLPTVLLSVWAVVLLVVDLWIPAGRKGMTALLAAIGAAASLGVNLMLIGMDYPDTGFGGMAVLDGFSIFANILILGSALLGIAVAYDYNRRTGIERGEYYVLLLLSSAGMMLIVQAYNLIVVFLALELLSIPLYILSGFARPQPKSEESALKYFLLGAFASAFFLYGAALVYGGSQHLDFPGILAAFQGGTIPILQSPADGSPRHPRQQAHLWAVRILAVFRSEKSANRLFRHRPKGNHLTAGYYGGQHAVKAGGGEKEAYAWIGFLEYLQKGIGRLYCHIICISNQPNQRPCLSKRALLLDHADLLDFDRW